MATGGVNEALLSHIMASADQAREREAVLAQQLREVQTHNPSSEASKEIARMQAEAWDRQMSMQSEQSGRFTELVAAIGSKGNDGAGAQLYLTTIESMKASMEVRVVRRIFRCDGEGIMHPHEDIIEAKANLSLPLEEILQLREDSIGEKARHTFAGLMGSASHDAVTKEVSLACSASLGSLISLLSAEVKTQQTRHRRWGIATGVLSVAAWVTGGLALACAGVAPMASFAISGLSFLVGAPFSQSVERRAGGTELVLLADEMQRRARK